MRILVVCGAGYVSGKEKIMFSLLKGFKASGHNVFCISSAWSNGQFEELLNDNRIDFAKVRLGFISKTFDLSAIRMTLHQMLYLPKVMYDYFRIISRFKPDVVIHSNFHHVFILYPFINGSGQTHIYHSHESIGNSSFYQSLFRLFDKKMKMFVGVSEYVSKRLGQLGINSHKIRTIHNGLEVQPFDRKDITRSVFTIGIVGQIGEWKGHEDLLSAAEILRKDKKDFQLMIFGHGDPIFVDKLKSLIIQKGLSDIVKWKGFVKDIALIYADLDVVCVPTRTEEPLATSALEAGLFGTPVIVTDKGGLPEIITHGHNGYIVDARYTAEQIALYIGVLINDRSLALEMGDNHRKIVQNRFTYKQFIDHWDALVQLS